MADLGYELALDSSALELTINERERVAALFLALATFSVLFAAVCFIVAFFHPQDPHGFPDGTTEAGWIFDGIFLSGVAFLLIESADRRLFASHLLADGSIKVVRATGAGLEAPFFNRDCYHPGDGGTQVLRGRVLGFQQGRLPSVNVVPWNILTILVHARPTQPEPANFRISVTTHGTNGVFWKGYSFDPNLFGHTAGGPDGTRTGLSLYVPFGALPGLLWEASEGGAVVCVREGTVPLEAYSVGLRTANIIVKRGAPTWTILDKLHSPTEVARWFSV
jgi:hypothetical protein